MKAQKLTKRVEEAPFSLLEASYKGAPAPLQTLFGQFLSTGFSETRGIEARGRSSDPSVKEPAPLAARLTKEVITKVLLEHDDSVTVSL